MTRFAEFIIVVTDTEISILISVPIILFNVIVVSPYFGKVGFIGVLSKLTFPNLSPQSVVIETVLFSSHKRQSGSPLIVFLI